jgi:Uma2 family endonuclease
MAVLHVAPISRVADFGPESNGILMTPKEFDSARFEDDWRYELIEGMLVVTPIPSRAERDPNELLGHWLELYAETHPQGDSLDATFAEETVRIGRNRRRADRLIWAGLGRLPGEEEKPTIVVEFVSIRLRDRKRDYQTKTREYLRLGVKEYWVIDRFKRTLTVFTRSQGRNRRQVFGESEVYSTELLPGFNLPLAKLLARADRWMGRAGTERKA